MTPMSGAALTPVPVGPRRIVPPSARPDPPGGLFDHLPVSAPEPLKRSFAFKSSVVGHTLIIAGLILIPIFWPFVPKP